MTLRCLIFGHLPASRVLDSARSEQERADWYRRAQRRVNNAEFWTVDPTHHCWRCGALVKASQTHEDALCGPLRD